MRRAVLCGLFASFLQVLTAPLLTRPRRPCRQDCVDDRGIQCHKASISDNRISRSRPRKMAHACLSPGPVRRKQHIKQFCQQARLRQPALHRTCYWQQAQRAAHQQVLLPYVAGCRLARLPADRTPQVSHVQLKTLFHGSLLEQAHRPPSTASALLASQSQWHPHTHRNFSVICAAWSFADIWRVGA